MTSFRSKQVVHKGFMPTFKVQGQVYHVAGSLFPHQVSKRCNREILDSILMRSIQDMFNTHNRHVKSFKTAIESVTSNVTDYKLVIHSNKVPNGEHRGRYRGSRYNYRTTIRQKRHCTAMS
ncbi:unnamed protein product [Macrosiphum euphorbiae]|uniref:Uncharacterized protein n=1 Tax=Macrosiphum euphorbiae TaxID=13131 RepID=A0AAV0X6W5_9HEMI|nr:unnamed protein product [Macrosiphum euphorbiae]